MKKGVDFMKYYVVDAFTDTAFKGNPAGICLCGHATLGSAFVIMNFIYVAKF